ncbi:MAG: hypothetical protein KDD25_02435, partial [Bdellovibrionales bacterium]|nr:hypothetical protein [Bdellovibrionales bacterium]
MRNPTGSKPLKSGIILAVACTIAFAYQNCGKVNFNSSPDKPFGKKSAAPGNGEGYEIRGPQDGEYLSYDLAFSPLNPDGIVAIRCEPT